MLVFADPESEMTETTSLLHELEQADMLLIDGLHAWQFELDEQGQLSVECMDGRTRRLWRFSAAAVAAARPGAAITRQTSDSASRSSPGLDHQSDVSRQRVSTSSTRHSRRRHRNSTGPLAPSPSLDRTAIGSS